MQISYNKVGGVKNTSNSKSLKDSLFSSFHFFIPLIYKKWKWGSLLLLLLCSFIYTHIPNKHLGVVLVPAYLDRYNCFSGSTLRRSLSQDRPFCVSLLLSHLGQLIKKATENKAVRTQTDPWYASFLCQWPPPSTDFISDTKEESLR